MFDGRAKNFFAAYALRKCPEWQTKASSVSGNCRAQLFSVRSSLADAEKVFVAAQKELAGADRGRGECLFAQFVARHRHEIRAGRHHVHHPFVVEEVHPAAGGHE